MFAKPPPPPIPTDPENAARWEHTGLRVRMLAGRWERDLERAIAKHIDPARQAAWGIPDVSSNIFRQVSRSLAVLYDRPPAVDHADPAAAPLIANGGGLDRAGIWSMMGKFSSWVIGCREYVMAIDVDDRGGLVYRPVMPNRVILGAEQDAPDVPVLYRELRLRTMPEGGDPVWTYDVFDIRDRANPSHRIETAIQGKKPIDITEKVLGQSFSGEAYPFRRADGDPIIPRVLYHAERHGQLWDAFEGSENLYGSLNCALLWTFFIHSVRDASWPQRYAVGAIPAGLGVYDGDEKHGRQAVTTDPASILIFSPEGDQQPVLGQFQPGAAPAALQEAIAQFEMRIAENAGVSPGDIQRMNSSARSGYAIALSNEGKREARARFESQFRRGDLELIEKSAIMLNRKTGAALPESGDTIVYAPIGMSAAERDSVRKDVLEKIESGLMSKVDAYMSIHPGISRDRAIEELERIRRENLLFSIPEVN